jgi:serine phosphatase RsbU (regulator of sigma subunit)
MNHRLSTAIRYYRGLPNRALAGYIAGTFLIFAANGFIGDAMHRPVDRPWDAVAVLASAAISGTIAVLFLLAPMRSWRYLPLAAVALVAGTFGIELMWQARAHLWGAAPVDLTAVQHRLTIDGRSATFALLLGFVLLVRFIRAEGIRQTRLRAEMELARDIHASLVPPLSFTTARAEVRGCSTPSSEVGGDLVDAFEHEGRLVVCVADVAGHGVPAGTLMAMVRSALRLELAVRALESLLADLNRLLLELGRPDRFATLACMRFGRNGSADYALAGHLPILRVRPGGSTVERLENVNLPLGIQSGEAFAAGVVPVGAGDLLAIFTDGLSEARDRAGSEFGIERLEALLLAHAAQPLAEIERRVFDAVRHHGPQADDQTLLLVRMR